MIIRKAVAEDTIKVVRSIQNKRIEYITPARAKTDIENGNMFILLEGDKILGILSLVYDETYGYYAMKRLCIPNKRNQGKGYAQLLLRFVANQAPGKVGCTPWASNIVMRHTLEKLGFTLEYTFDRIWCFYSRC